MRLQETVGDALTTIAHTLNLFVIGVPGRFAGGRIIAAFRVAGALSRSTAQRYRASNDNERAAFRALLASQIIRQAEVGRFYLDEEGLDAWLGWRRDP